ncbi:hypothetical protein BHE74_00006329, partial [Ensete ventricosum]
SFAALPLPPPAKDPSSIRLLASPSDPSPIGFSHAVRDLDMGDQQDWPPLANGGSSEGFSHSMPTNPDLSAVGPGNLIRAEQATAEVMRCIQPTVVSEQRRKAVVEYMQKLLKRYIGIEVDYFVAWSSLLFFCYLLIPFCCVMHSVLAAPVLIADYCFFNFMFCGLLPRVTIDFMLQNLQVFPFGSVPLKTYLPDGDIDLTALSFPNSEDALANDVRSVLQSEEQNKGAEFEVKDVQYINAEVFHSSGILFLDYYSKFDWDNYCVSLQGPIPVSFLPELVGNFYRIRSAFTYGARKLGRVLLLPAENIAAEVGMFFASTLERHGTGERPDVQQDASPSCSDSRFIEQNEVGSTSSNNESTLDSQVKCSSGALCDNISNIKISYLDEGYGTELQFNGHNSNKHLDGLHQCTKMENHLIGGEASVKHLDKNARDLNSRSYRERQSPGRGKNQTPPNQLSRSRNNSRLEVQVRNLLEGNNETLPQPHSAVFTDVLQPSCTANRGVSHGNGIVHDLEGKLEFGSLGPVKLRVSSPEQGKRLESVSPSNQSSAATLESTVQRPSTNLRYER